MVNNYRKRYSFSLDNREMQIKITLRSHFSPLDWQKPKSNNRKYHNFNIFCGWKWKLDQSLYRGIWCYLVKLKFCIFWNSAILIPNTDPREILEHRLEDV